MPAVVLIQLILLMMSTMLLVTCTELKYTYREIIVRQVGHLQELYRDALSTEQKTDFPLVFYNLQNGSY
jgi:gluconate kinase